MERQNSGRIYIPLKDIWFVLWNRKARILLVSVFFLLLGGTIAYISGLRKNAHPMYITSAAIAVISENQNGTFVNNSDNPSYNDVYLAQNMADSVIYVAKSDKVVEKVIEELMLQSTKTEQIKSALSLSQYENSQIIQISLNWYNPEEGIKILTKMTEILPDILIESLKIGNVVIVDYPKSAIAVTPMNIGVTMVVSAAIGLALGVAFYVLKLIYMPAVLSLEDLEEVIQVPVIGEIAKDRNLRHLNHGELVEKGEQVLSSLFVEQSSLCAHILRHKMDRAGEKVVLVTSALAGEGKTTIASALAWQMALQQKKVLLVDLDTRKPSVSKFFLKQVNESVTINAVAKKITDAESACISVSPYLDVMPGYLGKNRVRMDSDLIGRLKPLTEQYDMAILDTSPIGLVSDVMYLKQLTEKAILVVEQDKAWQGMVSACVDKLEKAGMEIFGCIFSKVDTTTPANRYYYRNYGYNSYYGTHAYLKQVSATKEETGEDVQDE